MRVADPLVAAIEGSGAGGRMTSSFSKRISKEEGSIEKERSLPTPVDIFPMAVARCSGWMSSALMPDPRSELLVPRKSRKNEEVLSARRKGKLENSPWSVVESLAWRDSAVGKRSC